MKIIVFNGSPKGDLSVTLQYVRFIQKRRPDISFEIINVAQRIKTIENNRDQFDAVIGKVREADGVLWSFPLYFMIVHAHLKRFIELIFENKAADEFKGKYAAAISTSIHFFDHTAHNYIQGISDDLGMHFVESYSADMNDLMEEIHQKKVLQFAENFANAISEKAALPRLNAPILSSSFIYQPEKGSRSLDTAGKKVSIIHDADDSDVNLAKMVARCKEVFSDEVTEVNIRDLDIKSSCQGCLKCGYENQCTFEGRDDFIGFFRNQIMKADILIFAGTIKDRYLSSRWKTLFDRSFFNTHTPVLIGKQLAYIVSGPYGQIANIKELFYGYAEFQGANVVGVVTDEAQDSGKIDAQLDQLMKKAVYLGEKGYIPPVSFRGEAGMKLFRDDIWGRLRFVFRADHIAFSKSGLYETFPQRNWGIRLMNFFGLPLLKIKPFRTGFQGMIKKQMVEPLKKLVDNL